MPPEPELTSQPQESLDIVENELPELLGADKGRIALRLKVGITGHRVLDDTDAVSRGIRAALRAIYQLLPSTDVTPVAFTVLSALAEGADRLVVREALGLASHAEVTLEVVLPLAVEDYIHDFQAGESRHEFDDLLAIAATRTEMPAAPNREEAYAHAGRYIVDRSDVVIAVWDGRRAQGSGGTAEIVAYGRERGVPMFVVPVRRSDATASTGVAVRPISDVSAIPPPRTAMNPLREARSRLDEYNRQSFGTQRLDRLYAHERARFMDSASGSSIEAQCAIAADWAFPHFVRADALALKYQRLYNTLGFVLYGLAALGVTAVSGQTVFASTQPTWALVEVGLLLSLLAALVLARRAGLHDRWFGFRSLAEAFRSSLFIALVGEAQQGDAHRASAPAGGAEPWFQRAFSEAWAGHPSFALDEVQAGALAQFLRTGWLERQIDYHHHTAERFRRERNWLTRAVFGLFAATIIIGLLHILEVGGASAGHAFVFLATTLPGFGAALTGVRDQRQCRLHETRARRTADRLQQLRADMAAGASSLAAVRRLASETQTVVEAENLDWSGVTEFQDLELIM